MAAFVFLTCPSCHLVVSRETDPDAISNTHRPAERPCLKCQRALIAAKRS